MANSYTTIETHKISHIRPTANDNIPHKKYQKLAIKSFAPSASYFSGPPKNVETNWKTSKLRLQWLNETFHSQ